MPVRITLTNHMHNANFCFYHVTPATNTLKAVKVRFVVWKGVFVAYIFYCTNQCSFIWHIWHEPYFCSKWNHSTVNWRQNLTDGGSVWSIYVLYNYLWLRKTLFCDCSCYRFFCKNFAAISIKIARRYKYL